MGKRFESSRASVLENELNAALAGGLSKGEINTVYALYKAHPKDSIRNLAKKVFQRHAPPALQKAAKSAGTITLGTSYDAKVSDHLNRLAAATNLDVDQIAWRVFQLSRRGIQFLAERGGPLEALTEPG
jgi:hypothetical protein